MEPVVNPWPRWFVVFVLASAWFLSLCPGSDYISFSGVFYRLGTPWFAGELKLVGWSAGPPIWVIPANLVFNALLWMTLIVVPLTVIRWRVGNILSTRSAVAFVLLVVVFGLMNYVAFLELIMTGDWLTENEKLAAVVWLSLTLVVLPVCIGLLTWMMVKPFTQRYRRAVMMFVIAIVAGTLFSVPYRSNSVKKGFRILFEEGGRP